MIGKTYTVSVQTALDDEAFIELPEEMLESVGWKEGDTINWKDNEDGSWVLTKVEQPAMEWVLVECVSTFRQRYMVEVPAGKAEWALDTVTMNEAYEFSQEHIGEQIFSHRVLSEDEAIEFCDMDNDYAKDWKKESKMANFFTRHKEVSDE